MNELKSKQLEIAFDGEACPLDTLVMPPCPYCERKPEVEHGKPNSAYENGYYMISCPKCSEKAEIDYPDGPMAYAWVNTFPWDTFDKALDEWITAVKTILRND